jgi:outer membrane cobalamin receptor
LTFEEDFKKMNMKSAILVITVLFFYAFSVYGQKIQISGELSGENGEPLLYASVSIIGSMDGTTTDENGKFSFFTTQKGSQILVGSYIGYESGSTEIIIADSDIEVELILSQKISELEEVVITAGSFEASDEKRAVIMRSRDIGTTAGATGDITRAIETLPGVQLVGESNGLFVRGGSGTESKVLIDEMVVQNPYYSPVPDTKQRGRFDPFMFSGTVFSTGGYSARYGQALSSILSLKSNGLADSTNTGGGIHSYGLNMFHVHRWNNSSVYLKGEYNNLAPYHKLFRQLTDWVKSPENMATTFSFRHRFSENDMLKLNANYSRTQLSINYTNPDSIDHQSMFSLKNDNLYINSTYKKYFDQEKWSLYLGSSYSKDVDHAFLDGSNMSEDEELVQGKIILSNKSIQGIELLGGSEFQVRNVEGKEALLSGRIQEVYASGFLEGQWHVSPRLGTRIGIRYEYSDFLKNHNMAPRLSLAYKTGKHGQVSFAYGIFYQTPDNQYLYYNKNLDFEHASHFIANYQFMKDRRVFRIELYTKEYHKLIKYRPGEDKAYTNLGDGYARGLDLFWRDQKSIPNADFWISYSFLDTRRDYHDFPAPATPYFASKHNLSVVYKHWIRKMDLMAGLTYSYASGRPYYDPQKPDDEFQTDLTPAYNNLSLNISKMLRLFNRSAVIYTSVDNVLGANHVFGYHHLPNDSGRIPIRPSSVRAFFIGFFISTY